MDHDGRQQAEVLQGLDDGFLRGVVGLDRSNATNSGGMLGEPFLHSLRRPEPLKGMGVPFVRRYRE